jgi:hypothetical protein
MYNRAPELLSRLISLSLLGALAGPALASGSGSGSSPSAKVTAATLKTHQANEEIERKRIIKAAEAAVSKKDPNVRALFAILKGNGYDSIKLASLNRGSESTWGDLVLVPGPWRFAGPRIKRAKPGNRRSGYDFSALKSVNIKAARRIEAIDLPGAIRDALDAARSQDEEQFRNERVLPSAD